MNQKKQIKLGLLGAGTVGGGVLKALIKDKIALSRKSGRDYEITAVCVKDLKKVRNIDFGEINLTENPEDIVQDVDIDIVVELIGGIEPAKTLVEKALNNKKHVVTANKALIASYGLELLDLARKKNKLLLFEGAVAGAIPIIKLMGESFLANSIYRIEGIINGTTNFMLSGMEARGLSLECAVSEAQKKGFAEADPTADISGLDAANKICILAYLAFGTMIHPDKIYCKGIDGLELQDITFSKQLGYKIKHLAIASSYDNKLNLRVHPALLAEDHPLAKIENEMNAVLTYGEFFEKILCSGPGAGSFPTASAVIADLIEIFRLLTMTSNSEDFQIGLKNPVFHDQSVEFDFDMPAAQYYLRITAEDQTGILALITKTLASEGISVEAIIQRAEKDVSQHVPIAIVTSKSSQAEIERVCQKLSNKSGILGKVVRYRVEN